MRIFGIDPGSIRTGYGCVHSDGTRHRLITCGAITTLAGSELPDRLQLIYRDLSRLIREAKPEMVVIENLFHARNVRSALTLGHARGVAVLAAVEAGLPLAEYTPAEIKQSVVGYGRAEKAQVQRMVALLLGLDAAPRPHDAADALAIALCHAHASNGGRLAQSRRAPRHERSWRHVKPDQASRRLVP